MCRKSVMEPIPHTQHRPICARANPVVVAHPTPFRRRLTYGKQAGTAIQQNSINLLKTLHPSQKTMVGSWTKYISRGFRTNHIPGLSEESKSLYEEYKKQYASDPFDNGTIETGNALMNNMKEEKKRWEEVITSTNMTHNSRKAWMIIKKAFQRPHLTYRSMSSKRKPSCSPIAHQQQRHDV